MSTLLVTPSVFSDLPPELILEIFSFAAGSHLPAAISLALVSSSVRFHTAQYLYAIVILRTARQVERFCWVLDLYEGVEWVDRGEEIEKGKEGSRMGLGVRRAKKMRIPDPATLVRHLCITHHSPNLSYPSHASPIRRDPYATLFTRLTHVNRAALQSTFLHSSLVREEHAVNRIMGRKNRFGGCREIMVIGPMFPSDWEMHLAEVEAAMSAQNNVDDDNSDIGSDIPLPMPAIYKPTSLLHTITHLRLLEPLSSPFRSGPLIASLPHLTHLALLIREPTVSNSATNAAMVVGDEGATRIGMRQGGASDFGPFVDLEGILNFPDARGKLEIVVVGFDYKLERGDVWDVVPEEEACGDYTGYKPFDEEDELDYVGMDDWNDFERTLGMDIDFDQRRYSYADSSASSSPSSSYGHTSPSPLLLRARERNRDQNSRDIPLSSASYSSTNTVKTRAYNPRVHTHTLTSLAFLARTLDPRLYVVEKEGAIGHPGAGHLGGSSSVSVSVDSRLSNTSSDVRVKASGSAYSRSGKGSNNSSKKEFYKGDRRDYSDYNYSANESSSQSECEKEKDPLRRWALSSPLSGSVPSGAEDAGAGTSAGGTRMESIWELAVREQRERETLLGKVIRERERRRRRV